MQKKILRKLQCTLSLMLTLAMLVSSFALSGLTLPASAAEGDDVKLVQGPATETYKGMSTLHIEDNWVFFDLNVDGGVYDMDVTFYYASTKANWWHLQLCDAEGNRYTENGKYAENDGFQNPPDWMHSSEGEWTLGKVSFKGASMPAKQENVVTCGNGEYDFGFHLSDGDSYICGIKFEIKDENGIVTTKMWGEEPEIPVRISNGLATEEYKGLDTLHFQDRWGLFDLGMEEGLYDMDLTFYYASNKTDWWQIQLSGEDGNRYIGDGKYAANDGFQQGSPDWLHFSSGEWTLGTVSFTNAKLGAYDDWKKDVDRNKFDFGFRMSGDNDVYICGIQFSIKDENGTVTTKMWGVVPEGLEDPNNIRIKFDATEMGWGNNGNVVVKDNLQVVKAYRNHEYFGWNNSNPASNIGSLLGVTSDLVFDTLTINFTYNLDEAAANAGLAINTWCQEEDGSFGGFEDGKDMGYSSDTRSAFTPGGWKDASVTYENRVIGGGHTLGLKVYNMPEDAAIYFSNIELVAVKDGKTYTATWIAEEVEKVVTVTAGEGGSVNSNTAKEGDSVTATAEDDYVFDGWYDGDTKISSDATYIITENTPNAIEARFVPNPAKTVTITAGEGGSVDKTTAKEGEKVTATANTNYSFTGWYDANGAKIADTLTYIITEDTPSTIQARFQPKSTRNIWLRIYKYGSVRRGDNTWTNDDGRVSGFAEGDVLTATAKEGYKFIGWGKDYYTIITDEPTYTITAASPEEIHVRFTKMVKIAADEGGTVNRDWAIEGDIIEAFPKEGYEFEGWYADSTRLGGAGATYKVTSTDAAMYTVIEARFVKKATDKPMLPNEPTGMILVEEYAYKDAQYQQSYNDYTDTCDKGAVAYYEILVSGDGLTQPLTNFVIMDESLGFTLSHETGLTWETAAKKACCSASGLTVQKVKATTSENVYETVGNWNLNSNDPAFQDNLKALLKAGIDPSQGEMILVRGFQKTIEQNFDNHVIVSAEANSNDNKKTQWGFGTMMLYAETATNTFAVDFSLPLTVSKEQAFRGALAAMKQAGVNGNVTITLENGNGTYGNVTWVDDTITYTLFKEMRDTDTFTFTLSGTKANGDSHSMPVQIVFVPANNVLYTPSILFGDSWEGSTNSGWTPKGDDTITLKYDDRYDFTSGKDRDLYGQKIYGYGGNNGLEGTDYYTDITTVGKIYEKANAEGGASLKFEFQGTAIDIYAWTSMTTGTVRAILRDSKGKALALQIVDTEYSDYEGFYNVPVVHFDCSDYNNGEAAVYTVDLYVLEKGATIANGRGEFRFHGIRVYHSVQETGAVHDRYAEDGELSAKFIQLRQVLLGNGGDVTSKQPDGATYFVDYREKGDTWDTVYTIKDYIDYGPKNEVYLVGGQSITFTVPAYCKVQIGAKFGLAKFERPQFEVKRSDRDEIVRTGPMNTAVEMYYDLGETDGEPVTYTITCKAGTAISLTNLKLISTVEGGESQSLALVNSAHTADMALAMLNGDTTRVAELQELMAAEDTTIAPSSKESLATMGGVRGERVETVAD